MVGQKRVEVFIVQLFKAYRVMLTLESESEIRIRIRKILLASTFSCIGIIAYYLFINLAI